MMEQRFYRFAGLEFSINMDEDRMYTEERRLAPFRVDSVSDPHVFTFHVVEDLATPEGACISHQPGFLVYESAGVTSRYIGSVQRSWTGAYIGAHHRDKIHTVQLRAEVFPGRVSTKVVLNSLELEHLVAPVGGFVFHCAYIEWRGKGILFTAPSGTGKSTQANLWHSLRGARIINGDRGVVRWADDRIVAEGIPFSGSSEYCENASLPLAAIVYLGQAPATSIRRLRGYEAFRRIWEGCSVNTWDSRDVSLISESVMRVAQTVPVYHLTCTPDESAVIALEDALREKV